MGGWLFFAPFWLFAQGAEATGPNIVPNPSFEDFSTVPLGWFYKGEHYTRLMQFWSSPTAASPDVFGPKVRVPEHWADKDFGKDPPHSGWAMSGITVYGCSNGKPHCREYVQVRLAEPLVPDQLYQCRMHVLPLPGSMRVGGLGFLFSEQPPTHDTDEPIEARPQVAAAQILDAEASAWAIVEGTFTADRAYEYLTIGNFQTDEATPHQPAELPYAYYYIDDVSVVKLPPYLPVPVPEDDLTRTEITEGETVQLKNILFDFDSWALHPRSYVELKKLLQIMRERPGMRIEIIGHTDSIGADEYNQYLSRKRAKSVVLYLLENGISANRLDYRGAGEDQPVATNTTDEGRQLNRRVEFRVVSL